MKNAEIVALQKRVGTPADGFWGPQSIAACQNHLRSLMPFPSPWPRQDQKSLTDFYGLPGDESQLVKIDVNGFGVMYDGKDVSVIRCHEKVAGSLRVILRALSGSPFRYVLSKYAGVYNNRKMRGGSLPSLHARGAAIDIWPERNGNRTHWPISAAMPIEVMELFSMEGWLSAGAFWSRDAMHMEATSRP